jgi:hypothetical protein
MMHITKSVKGELGFQSRFGLMKGMLGVIEITGRGGKFGVGSMIFGHYLGAQGDRRRHVGRQSVANDVSDAYAEQGREED